ncbi:LexA family protein [Anaerococcus tetradius]|nr:XRE family transcriptional regulator [Anaerococcus tetradius]
MTNLTENLKYYRKLNGYTQETIAPKLNIKTSAYGSYEQGRNEPPYSKLKMLASIYGISISELTGEPEKKEPIQNKDYITINIYGSIPAGIPIEAIEDISDTEDLSLKEYDKNKTYLGLRVDGDSMYPKYLDGDTVIIEKTPDCESGTDAAVYVNGYEATLKTVIKNENGTITLKPINANYAPRTYGPGDDPVRILGVVKEIRRKI